MTLAGYSVNSTSLASGGELIKATGSGAHTATQAFAGSDGVYDLKVTYWDENDGAATLGIYVNGASVDSFVWNQNLGNANLGSQNRTSHTTGGISLHPGDVVELRGIIDGGEPVRVDSLDFQFKSPLAPVDHNPSVVSASIGSVVAAGGSSSTLTVTYADDGALDASSIGVGDVTVTGPGGAVAVTGVTLNNAANGSPRTATYTIAAPGGSWDRGDNGSYTIGLKS